MAIWLTVKTEPDLAILHYHQNIHTGETETLQRGADLHIQTDSPGAPREDETTTMQIDPEILEDSKSTTKMRRRTTNAAHEYPMKI